MVHLFAVPFQRLTDLHKHFLRTLRDRQDKSSFTFLNVLKNLLFFLLVSIINQQNVV